MLKCARASSDLMKKKEKNGAHTHVRTTVQLGECNIHVGCCLFSHNPDKCKTLQNELIDRLSN